LRAGIEQLEELGRVYESEPVEALLRMASRRSWPWDSAPSFSDKAIADALARSRERVNLLSDARAPFWRLSRDRLSVMSQPIPTGDVWHGFLVVIVSSSTHAGRLLANMNRALELAGSDPEQLVTSMEHRELSGGCRHHVIACIPGSR
jgi:hypothetical protein